jgi:hypothetical protein
VPRHAAEVFKTRSEHNFLLSVTFRGVVANCHFFEESRIEFDIDPRAVTGEEQAASVFDFMHWLSGTTMKDVILTPENRPEIVVFRVRPATKDVEWSAFGGWR